MIYKQIGDDIIEPIGDITIHDYMMNNYDELTTILGSEPVIDYPTPVGIMLIGYNSKFGYGERDTTYKVKYGDDLIESIKLVKKIDEDYTPRLLIVTKQPQSPGLFAKNMQ